MSQETVVSVGSQVPEFEMDAYDPQASSFSKVSLAELKKQGKWTVLLFYPADFTFVCPTELADLGNKHAQLREIGAEAVSVSTDTKYTHMAWQRDEKLLSGIKYPMAADPTGAVSKLFGVYNPSSGLARRGTFIINPQGELVSSEISYIDVGRSADELLRKVQACVYVAENPGEACPAKWEPGSKTLKPGEKIVGKVFEALNS
jgi:peroxiredoxin (alkyl hydroperoxide reductase subunit C)